MLQRGLSSQPMLTGGLNKQSGSFSLIKFTCKTFIDKFNVMCCILAYEYDICECVLYRWS